MVSGGVTEIYLQLKYRPDKVQYIVDVILSGQQCLTLQT